MEISGLPAGSKPAVNNAASFPEFPTQDIRAELSGSDVCAAAGITVRGHAPVLSLCRSLIVAGLNPDAALEVYRRGVLALRVRSLAAGAALRVREDRGVPEFAPYRASKFDRGPAGTATDDQDDTGQPRQTHPRRAA